ncbi:hypothetical protein TCAL_09266 [Tigriopus californicus]|uniref:Anion exchange protein n=1 Tax=Tigriopus californicus TaxID=6832 RepID=A0A553N8X2_TIGCA|nr:hypothetical protein TCAL_09266 [Tigriopus californicus]|eukprot:TCALIF_09266-PA protein Name:"Similar to SLC4A8 Electroneutral sodium bicarbonate exchanger 1 (Homo sapiens)" AED:0.06 eAED:0.06 QI:10/0.92/0.93/1/0.85/0.93/15/357/1140
MDGGNSEDLEAPKDPGALKHHAGLTDTEIDGHRNVYVGIHIPGRSSRRPGSNKGARTHHRHKNRHLKGASEANRPVTPPAQRVQFILGEDHDDNGHEPHPLFSEMEELFLDENGEMEWKETARWVKFEEDVEEGGNRWSKPHVATLSLHSLFELRHMLLNGTVCLDMSAGNLDDIAELTLDNMVNANLLPYDKKVFVKDAILKKHRHLYEKQSKHGESSSSNISKLPLIRSLADIGRNHSSSKSAPGFNNGNGDDPPNRSHKSDAEINGNESTNQISGKMNTHFMKKLPKGVEASNILVGELNILDKPLSAFIRLSEAVFLGDLTEVPVPTRFIFILLGPPGDNVTNVGRYHEIGRAVATIMSDEVFHDVAYKAKKREHLLAGLDEFLDAVTVLPPGEWDPSIRIEPPQLVPSQENRKKPKKEEEKVDEEEEERKQREETGLVRTGRLFGGLINDVKRVAPFYLSDFTDAISVQCIASFIFIYFACLTPIITFGGMLGDATENRIAAIESLVSGFVVGVVYGLFSGQPLTILGSTGPILVFETILYDACRKLEWEYLPFRFCVGIWVGFFLLLLVATDASAFVCYITRFTEENFATLIAFIFIKKAIEKLMHISDNQPIHESDCFCKPNQKDLLPIYGTSSDFLAFNETKPFVFPCEFTSTNGTLVMGVQSVGCHYYPNAYLMSVLLFVGTFLIAYHLKNFKTATFFPTNVRATISDFAVIIAIFSMTLTDYLVRVDTPKLMVPSTLRPTWSGRGWLIHPVGNNPWFTPIVAMFPAILATILIFMDQQITAVIVNRKEHKLKKGSGYHLDLLIVMILIIFCSIFGLPWFVAATVLSINHVKSLTRESECAAPGEKPQFLGIREQRVTHVLIFIFIGVSVFLGPMLKHIPMPVLYGVFLYMGVASLNGLQFFDRLLLFFMPKKYQPDLPYLRRVPINRVHLFTCVQFACLVGLWIIKDIKETSILFPIMLVVMMGVRKSLDLVFSKTELKILDDILPEFKRREKLNKEELDSEVDPDYEAGLEKRRASLRYTESSVEVPLANGNIMKIPVDSDINISEEMNKSGVWKSFEGSNSGADISEGNQGASSLKKRKSSAKRMSVVTEDEEDAGIRIKIDRPKSEHGTDEELRQLVKNENDDETVV